MSVDEGIGKLRRNGRTLVVMGMVSLTSAVGGGLLAGGTASATCYNTGYGETVCTHPSHKHHAKHHKKHTPSCTNRHRKHKHK